MATYQDHIDNLTSAQVESANKALDYLDGDQEKWLISLLDDKHCGIKKWRDRGLSPKVLNLTGEIIGKSAKSYSDEPKRTVYVNGEKNDAATEVYLDLLDSGDFDLHISIPADKTSRLLRVCMVLAQAVDVVGSDSEIRYHLLHRGNCDVDYDPKTNSIKSLLYFSGATSVRGNKLYTYWDDTNVYDIEAGDSGLKASVGEAHGYGMIPVAILWDTTRPRAGFWPKNAWDDVITMNEGINKFNTSAFFNADFQAFGAIFTNAEIADGQIIGPDAVVKLDSQPGDNVYFEYKTPSINLEEVSTFLDGYVESVGSTYGVKVSAGGTGQANSGFQLVVEEIPSLETSRLRLKSARSFENQLFKVVKAISKKMGYKIPEDSWIDVDFKEPSLPVNEKEKWNITKEKIATKYMAVEEAWVEENPDLTEEQINERKLKVGGTTPIPTFNAIGN